MHVAEVCLFCATASCETETVRLVERRTEKWMLVTIPAFVHQHFFTCYDPFFSQEGTCRFGAQLCCSTVKYASETGISCRGCNCNFKIVGCVRCALQDVFDPAMRIHRRVILHTLHLKRIVCPLSHLSSRHGAHGSSQQHPQPPSFDSSASTAACVARRRMGIAYQPWHSS